MAIKVIVQVDGAADWITANANARFRLDRDTTAAFAAATEVITTVLVSGTERYETWDASGTTTSWYRFRIEDASDVALSGWSTPFQVTEDQQIATLASVKLALGTGATATDDDALAFYIGGVNEAIIHRIGYYPGPSSDTTRSYDGKDAKSAAVAGDARRLWIPGGVRTVTSLTLGATAAAGTAATSTAYGLFPRTYLLRPGEPYHWLEFYDVTTGNWSSFPFGYANCVIVGLFGWGRVPPDLVRLATAWAIRSWKARNSGDADVLGTTEFGEQIVSDRFPAQWRATIDSYRIDGWIV